MKLYETLYNFLCNFIFYDDINDIVSNNELLTDKISNQIVQFYYKRITLIIKFQNQISVALYIVQFLMHSIKNSRIKKTRGFLDCTYKLQDCFYKYYEANALHIAYTRHVLRNITGELLY